MAKSKIKTEVIGQPIEPNEITKLITRLACLAGESDYPMFLIMPVNEHKSAAVMVGDWEKLVSVISVTMDSHKVVNALMRTAVLLNSL